jgi:formate/nitrite transporter FocA (FNT family)
MITHQTKTTLLALSIVSLLTTIVGNLLPNLMFNFSKQSFLLNDDLSWQVRLLAHHEYGVCAFGLITGVLLCVFLIAQIVYLSKLDNKDKDGRKKLGKATLGVMSVYFISQLVANSYFSHRSRGLSNPKIGLFEFMLPTYALQIAILVLIYSEKSEDVPTPEDK